MSKNKILGYAPHIGVYELGPVKGPDGKIHEDGQTAFVLERGSGENYMRFSFVSRYLRVLMGEVLTVVDATLTDPRQLKAVKDLIKKDFSLKINWIYEQCGYPEDEQHFIGFGTGDVGFDEEKTGL